MHEFLRFSQNPRRDIMTTIGPIYPAQILVSQAEIKLVADQTSNAAPTTIRADEQSLSNAQKIEAAESRVIDIVT
jgi:hypothetical protein